MIDIVFYYQRLFIIGSNNAQTRFRVLKIDRTERDLIVIDDKVEYTQHEIRDMLTRVEVGNRQAKSSSGLNKTISAFGIVGFVRFLEGYYLILITKRRRVAQLGHHVIYKIEDTSMIYIPSEKSDKNSQETKYVKLFQNIDLSSNFYFSYSYDITHTLQYNLANCETIDRNEEKSNVSEEREDGFRDPGYCRTQPHRRFAWNEYLLKSVDFHPDWIIYVTHGFVSQANINVYGRPLYLTLIARRSQRYAGTRFLKRGSNCEGDVANEVETEQIVYDASISSFRDGHFTSFVQLRGSIPSHWSQDISKMVPKPTIVMDLYDPFCRSAGLHFSDLLHRYGSKIIVLNLVKRREQKPHESVLCEEFLSTINYLNQFLPPELQIEYIGFDMARINKLKDASVMSRLSEIAYHALQSTGIFQSKIRVNVEPKNNRSVKKAGGVKVDNQIFQTGVVRVNCVDCLDRTNTAQFALGKVALAFQLHSLGVIEKPVLEFETDTVRMLEELYEDHGDTLALQYGGSQLVHRIKTYRKIAPLSSHSRDIMQTLSRYYSNTFSDADKQSAMNLFLGVYEANKFLPIWELTTDYYIHHSEAMGKNLHSDFLFTCWWKRATESALPRYAIFFKACSNTLLFYRSAMEVFKGQSDELFYCEKDNERDERVDGYYEQYRPYELTVFADLIAFNMLHTSKDFMPNFTANYSPFSVRRNESLVSSSGAKLTNPSLSGNASTSSTSSASEVESETEEEMDHLDLINYAWPKEESELSPNANFAARSFRSALANSKDVYGLKVMTRSANTLNLYNRYVNFTSYLDRRDTVIDPIQKQEKLGTSFSVPKPVVSDANLQIYKQFVASRKTLLFNKNDNAKFYEDYIKIT